MRILFILSIPIFLLKTPVCMHANPLKDLGPNTMQKRSLEAIGTSFTLAGLVRTWKGSPVAGGVAVLAGVPMALYAPQWIDYCNKQAGKRTTTRQWVQKNWLDYSRKERNQAIIAGSTSGGIIGAALYAKGKTISGGSLGIASVLAITVHNWLIATTQDRTP
jgi:hypothetical protein